MVAVFGSIAPVASAVPADFTWKGAALSEHWSAPANWVGGVAPSGVVGTLSFPQLGSPCPEFIPFAWCGFSENDLTGISAKALKLDNGGYYEIWGKGIALGEGGLSAGTTSSTPGVVFLELPLELSASQTWSVDGNDLRSAVWLDAGVTGSSSSLTVRLAHKGYLVSETFEPAQPSDLETGAVTVEGANLTALPSENGAVDLIGGRVNASDEKPVKLIDAGLFGEGTVGSLTTSGGSLQAGSREGGILKVAGTLTLDPESRAIFLFNHVGTVAGVDYTRLSTTGAVDLAGAHLSLIVPAEDCPALNVGDVATLISTTGVVSGLFAGVSDGAIATVSCPSATKPKVRINYTEHAVIATVVAEPPPPLPEHGPPIVPPPPPKVVVLGTAAVGVSASEIRALLGSQLIPSGKAARIGALLRAKGFARAIRALEAGSVQIAWYASSAGAKSSRKAKPVLIAAGRLSLSGPGAAVMKIKLTAAGRRLLKHARRLTVTARGTFTPSAAPPVTVTKTFRLRR